MKKIFTQEVKIGIAFIVAIVMAYIGINYLKGINIFTPTNHYYATFDNVGGLLVSNSVYVKGYKVGQVRDIQYDFTKENSFVVELTVEDNLKLPKGTIVRLYDESIMGGKALELVYSEDFSNFHITGDTLISEKQIGLMGMLGDLAPKLEGTINHVDSLIVSVDNLARSQEIKNSLKSFESTMADLTVSSAKLKVMMNHQVPTILENVNQVSGDLKKVSADLKQMDLVNLYARIDKTIANLQIFSDNLNQKDGTLGMLMHDKELYKNLTDVSSNANLLLLDLKENPKRYVHFSLWGPKEKKETKKEQK